MLCLPVHMPTSQRVPPRAATGPDSSMIMLRFIFALAVHTAMTSAATVSVKEGADESHRQLGASDCKQHVGQEQSERRIVLQLLRQPWKRRGQALVASGRKCQVRPGRPCLRRLLRVQDELQAARGMARGPRPERRVVRSCCNFSFSALWGVWQPKKRPAPHNCKRQQKGAALYEYINEPCDNTRHTVCAALRMFDTVARPNQKKAGVCAEERERKNSARSLIR